MHVHVTILVIHITLYFQVVKEDYCRKEALPGPEQLVEFELDQITLNIPPEGITLKEGWKITPLIVPVVSTHNVTQ